MLYDGFLERMYFLFGIFILNYLGNWVDVFVFVWFCVIDIVICFKLLLFVYNWVFKGVDGVNIN